jgi:hypothetical protein
MLQRPTHGQELHNELRVIVAFTLVESVDYQHKNCWAPQPRQRLEDEVLPLVAQRLAGDFRTLHEGITDMTPDIEHAPRKLDRNAGDESACPADITAASREEKAGTQLLLCMIPAGDRACDCCFASASQAAQPKNVLLTLPICPFVYPFQEINAGVGEAGGLVLRGI